MEDKSDQTDEHIGGSLAVTVSANQGRKRFVGTKTVGGKISGTTSEYNPFLIMPPENT